MHARDRFFGSSLMPSFGSREFSASAISQPLAQEIERDPYAQSDHKTGEAAHAFLGEQAPEENRQQPNNDDADNRVNSHAVILRAPLEQRPECPIDGKEGGQQHQQDEERFVEAVSWGDETKGDCENGEKWEWCDRPQDSFYEPWPALAHAVILAADAGRVVLLGSSPCVDGDPCLAKECQSTQNR